MLALGFAVRIKTSLRCQQFLSQHPRVPAMANGTTSTPSLGNSLADGKYSDTRRKMLDLVNRLQSNGASLDLDLPQIAVIGNQSAGKSSLIESISGISLPRASGTCTRCPTECKLSQTAGQWKCTVALRFIEDKDGNPIHPVQNKPFGNVMTDKNEVEDRLRRAQLAILCPSKDSETFLDMDDSELDEVEQSGFSRNCISLQITGPDVPDLSFVDLPGIIASVKDAANRGDIEHVKNLVSEHICKPSCIILLTVSCETDFENQGAYQLATEHDPEGHRTIGVLTKVDRIGEGDSTKWIRMLDGSEQRLLHGWFGVKQLNTRELEEHISREEARSREAQFFSGTIPWSNLVSLKNRLGTPRLTTKLSEVLTALIAKRIPELQDEVTKLLAATEAALRELPGPPSEDPISELLGLIGGFARTIAADVQGTPASDGLIQSIREEYVVFRRAVRATAPDFQPFPRAQNAEAESSYLNPEFVPADEHVDAPHGAPIYVDEVMNRAVKSITRELPDNYPYIVTREYISVIIKHWEQPAKELFIAIERKFSAHVKRVIKVFFAQHSAGGLDQAVTSAVTKHLSKCRDATLDRLRWLLDIERDPFTLNDHYLAEYKRKYFAMYKLARQRKEYPGLMDNLQPLASTVNDAISMLQRAGMKCRKEDLPNLLPTDPMDYALRIMAEVRAYYHVAYKRYTDNVPLAIDFEYLRGFERGVEKCLYESLGVSSSEARTKAGSFLRQADDVVSQREDLHTRLERLEKTNSELSDLWM